MISHCKMADTHKPVVIHYNSKLLTFAANRKYTKSRRMVTTHLLYTVAEFICIHKHIVLHSVHYGSWSCEYIEFMSNHETSTAFPNVIHTVSYMLGFILHYVLSGLCSR
jgi:hypothetical protein